MSISQAFAEVCKNAKSKRLVYLSLYRSDPFYGGPEEGGWWGSDTHLVAYEEFSSNKEALLALEKVEKFAETLEIRGKIAYGMNCQEQIEWCEARGIEDSNTVFGEVDGPSRFFCRTEYELGRHEHRGTRHYE